MLSTHGRLLEPYCLLPVAILALVSPDPTAAQQRPRARDLGVTPGVLQPGPQNAITDVAGVRVGHTTITRGRLGTHRRHRHSASRR